MEKFCVILPAAGRSTRFGDPKEKKIYADLDGRAVWLRSVEPFINRDDVVQVILVISREDRELFDRRYQASVAFLGIQVIEGGAERSDSIAKALEVVRADCDLIAIHDAARPCLTTEQVDAVFEAARKHGAALLAIPVADTIKVVDEKRFTTGTIPRQGIFLAQTPQVFRREWLMTAYSERERLGSGVTDDTQLVEAIGHRCAIVQGSSLNLKITTKDDLILAEAIIKADSTTRRTKTAHPFVDENKMWGDLPKLNPSDIFGTS
jgi:2-C-methyl-D-erythritol 4-phosphate cytidylyltransferase